MPMIDQERPTITIKLKPYLQEYLICELRSEVAYKTNIIGKLLKPLLEKRPKDAPVVFHSGPEYITLGLPFNDDLNIRGNLWISPRNQAIFEEYLEWHFKQLFFHYMNDKVRYTRSFKKAILQFCTDHNFTFSSMNYELLKKDYYRKRKRKNPKNILPDFVPELSPECPWVFLKLESHGQYHKT